MNNSISKTLSVIVPVYNGAEFLPACLEAIFSSDFRDFEVIAVDDGSTDESAEICRSFGAKVIETERQQSGPAHARNLAAKISAAEILVFVDADVVVKPDTLRKFAERFTSSPEISAVFGSYDNRPAKTNFLSQYKNLQHHFVHQTSNPEASTFWSGLGAVKRTVFLDFGGFDEEKFEVPSIEDIDLGVRLRQKGHRIMLDREIQAKHLKEWRTIQMLKTEIFCRALPWSKLILTSQGLVNDMNLKSTDRACAVFVALTILSLPCSFLFPWLLIVPALSIFAIVLLNRQIFLFFAREKGVLFAAMTIPWQFLYFLYSGAAFAYCVLIYSVPRFFGFLEKDAATTSVAAEPPANR
ncbi:MAG: glycosyltransferase family 2 protein [Pyrinomonadaceae bacterium]|nr:glycosyltransferase family 2 protein [Pyrinomonadaceae bacterium]